MAIYSACFLASACFVSSAFIASSKAFAAFGEESSIFAAYTHIFIRDWEAYSGTFFEAGGIKSVVLLLFGWHLYMDGSNKLIWNG